MKAVLSTKTAALNNHTLLNDHTTQSKSHHHHHIHGHTLNNGTADTRG